MTYRKSTIDEHIVKTETKVKISNEKQRKSYMPTLWEIWNWISYE
jgi:hypothetical protein